MYMSMPATARSSGATSSGDRPPPPSGGPRGVRDPGRGRPRRLRVEVPTHLIGGTEDIRAGLDRAVGRAPPLHLLVLVGTSGHMRLEWLDGALETALPLPADGVQWVSGNPGRGLVATAGPDGRIFLSGPVGRGERPAWREVPVDAGGREWLGQPLADAVIAPTGDAIAVVAADPASGLADGHLVVLDPVGRPSHARVLTGRWDGRAPAWLSSDRVAVSTRDPNDATDLTIVDLGTGALDRWGTSVAAFAVSGDGRTIAWQDRDDRQIRVGPLERALAGGAIDRLPADPAARLAAQIVLDSGGQRIGVAWLDDAGDTTAWTVYEMNAGGWAVERGGALPRGVSRAVLVSLGP
jgi:hypothetical protein